MSAADEATPAEDAVIVGRTRQWLEQVVIGLNLCPFANSVFRKNQIDYRISRATDTDQLVQDLLLAAESLIGVPAEQIDTALLIHPQVLTDFSDYNDFLGMADALFDACGLSGVLQIASFHPDYRFADAEPDDITHATNRSPYPMLHLLRETSLDKAIAAHPNTDAIVQHNLATMRRLGWAGWAALQPAAAYPARPLA
ncbi:MAG: DUF1415 domain-containing protein [Burkholderiaceae bacterium]|nr:DUF1415 domain-containing protein [Burkholderiaceae bacterium]